MTCPHDAWRSIADTPAALTPEWITGALRSSGRLGAGTVTDVELSPVGTGQMCDSLRLSLRFDGGRSTRRPR